MFDGLVVAMAVLAGGGPALTEPESLMTAADVAGLPRPPADFRIDYGPKPLQFGELRLPDGGGPHPVVIVIHGGCWLAEYDLGYISALADALTAAGVATWSLEYRRVGDEGGGWPATFQDVADAADFLRTIAPEYGLDLNRVAALGHSAGGHLALWLAGRSGLAADDPLRGRSPLPLAGVVSLAGIPDLATYAAPSGCGAAVAGLLGAEPDEVPERVRRGSPIAMVPLGVPLIMVTGELDSIVPAEQGDAFAAEARREGDVVEVRVVVGAGHFELVNPAHPAFETVRGGVFELLGERSKN